MVLFYLNLLGALAVCVTLHECAHAWVATRLGDPTPKMEGRVSLNPLRHLDPLGTLMIFLVQFGWGKPVYLRYEYLKHPRRDSALIALAGPAANLLTALLVGFIFCYSSLPSFFLPFLKGVYGLSTVLFFFNLLPLPPLDGSKLLGLFLPHSWEQGYERFLAQGPVALILFIIGDRLIAEVFHFSFLQMYLEWGHELLTWLLFLVN